MYKRQTQDALGELASLGVEDLAAVEKAAKSFSDQWAGTSKADFITASYDIKSGIASLSDEGVAKFTELAALTGKATKSTTEEMGSLFATGYGIYKNYYDQMSDIEFGELFSAGKMCIRDSCLHGGIKCRWLCSPGIQENRVKSCRHGNAVCR